VGKSSFFPKPKLKAARQNFLILPQKHCKKIQKPFRKKFPQKIFQKDTFQKQISNKKLKTN